MAESPDRRLLLRTALAAMAASAQGVQAQSPARPPAPTASRAAPATTPATTPAWAAWTAFKAQFISEGGRVISDDGNNAQTYSEGQGYAMFFALVANDRPAFETILRWTENNLAEGDLTARLPAWLWGRRPDGTWGVLDANAASDSDLWIAYTLCEAGRLWNERRYRALGTLLAARIVREETADLPGLGLTLLPAPKGFAEEPGRWKLNPSYLTLQLMQALASHEAPSPWKALIESSRKVITGSAPQGFSPDWTIYDGSKQAFLIDEQGKEKGQGTYNAIRVYLWAGMLHPDTPGRRAVLDALAPMARYVREQGYPPESIDIRTGKGSGPAPSGFSAALLPFLQALPDRAALQSQLQRLDARPLRPTAYYEQTLALFGLGWHQGLYRFSANGELLPRWKP